MAFALASLRDALEHGFDAVIDVRSPAEFAEDRLPGAINLPVLSDAERARVGTIYVQDDPFRARKIGAALVAANAARHLQGPLAGKDGGWRPLVYCWRGGQRSGSFASILSQVGWRVETLQGGYRSWRRLVVGALYEGEWPVPVLLLDGYTGTAKTEILARVGALGGQVLDLESLARHRGSVLGGWDGEQPAQRGFESALAAALARLDPDRAVLIEAESSKVGDRLVPPALWKAMRAAPRLEIVAPAQARAAYLARAYADVTADPERLAGRLEMLRRLRGAEQVAAWQALARAGAFEELAAELMAKHYDPAYRRGRDAVGAAVSERLETDSLDGPALDRLAEAVKARLDAMRGGNSGGGAGGPVSPGSGPAGRS